MKAWSYCEQSIFTTEISFSVERRSNRENKWQFLCSMNVVYCFDLIELIYRGRTKTMKAKRFVSSNWTRFFCRTRKSRWKLKINSETFVKKKLFFFLSFFVDESPLGHVRRSRKLLEKTRKKRSSMISFKNRKSWRQSYSIRQFRRCLFDLNVSFSRCDIFRTSNFFFRFDAFP